MRLDPNIALVLVTIISVPLFMGAAFWLMLIYRHRRNVQLHATILQLADKGLPVPPGLVSPKAPPSAQLHWALTLTGLGVGAIAYLFLSNSKDWSIGLIPLAIGLAQLLAWRIGTHAARRDDDEPVA